jgi:hypothetical protein
VTAHLETGSFVLPQGVKNMHQRLSGEYAF